MNVWPASHLRQSCKTALFRSTRDQAYMRNHHFSILPLITPGRFAIFPRLLTLIIILKTTYAHTGIPEWLLDLMGVLSRWLIRPPWALGLLLPGLLLTQDVVATLSEVRDVSRVNFLLCRICHPCSLWSRREVIRPTTAVPTCTISMQMRRDATGKPKFEDEVRSSDKCLYDTTRY